MGGADGSANSWGGFVFPGGEHWYWIWSRFLIWLSERQIRINLVRYPCSLSPALGGYQIIKNVGSWWCQCFVFEHKHAHLSALQRLCFSWQVPAVYLSFTNYWSVSRVDFQFIIKNHTSFSTAQALVGTKVFIISKNLVSAMAIKDSFHKSH